MLVNRFSRLPAVALLFIVACAAPMAACTGATDDDDDGESSASALAVKLAPTGVTASSHDGNVPANVIDGKLDTRWSAEGDGQWIRLDLGVAKKVASIKIAFHKGKERVARFDVQTSTDGNAWSSVLANAKSSGKSNSLQTFALSTSTGRYVRVVGHGNTQNKWNSFTEIEVLGEEVAAPPPTTTSTTPPPPPPPPGTVNYPSDLLDLVPWKLTLPLPGSSNTSPREILDLEDYANAPWFTLNTKRDGVVFRANCGGTTTSNSSYPRSELREMTASGAKASWSTTSGKHSLTLREAITATPAVKPHVVAGQIHDAEDDVIMIRLEGKRLFVEGGGKDLAELDTNYTLGKIFDVKMEAQNGNISVSYNGVNKLVYKKSVDGCYFKAGAYTQSNTSKGDSASAYGEVVIYGMTLRHE